MALWVDGFEPKEIAEVLGRTPAAIRQRLFAARERLRQRHQQELRDSRGPERSASAPTKEVRP
jgi:DNA-directed RNA polymerase specialized sigma24 family protein